MNRLILFVMCSLFAGFAAIAAEEPAAPVAAGPAEAALAALDAGQIDAAELRWVEIKNPAAQLLVQSAIERARGDLKGALETLAKSIVLYPHDKKWTPKSEVMMIVLYMESGMLDAADVVARQVLVLHEGAEAAARAKALRLKIDKLKETE